MATYLVTGANRGIGLELCRQLRDKGQDVIAACRHSSVELDGLGVRVESGVDVADDGVGPDLARRLAAVRLDVLIHNAGVLERVSFEDLDLDSIRRQFEVNALGPLRVTRGLVDRLRPGAKVVIVTSLMGSMTDNTSGGHYGYRMSKAAVNMAGVSLAQDLRHVRVAVALLHPGMVRTDMTGHQGIPVEESARGLLARVDELTLETSGSFRHSNGKAMPW